MPTQAYICADGKRVPGTTTIIGRFKDSFALLRWTAKRTRELDLMAIQALGPGPIKLVDAVMAIITAKTSSDHVSDEADAGTVCHQWIDDVAHERELTSYPDLLPEMRTMADNGLQAFREWWDLHQFTVVSTEQGLVSEKYRYGGTLDMLARDKNGELCMLDWKAANAIYPEQYVPQIAAYSNLAAENGLGDVTRAHLFRAGKKDASGHHHNWSADTMQKGWELFLLYRTAYDMANYLKKL